MAIECRNCGHLAPMGDRFCGHCGSELAPNETEPSAEAEDSSWISLAGESVAALPLEQPSALAQPIEVVDAATPAVDDPDIAEEQAPAPDPAPRREKAVWIAVIAVSVVGALALVFWTMSWAGGSSDRTELAATSDDPSAPEDAWKAAYTDTYLPGQDVDVVTGAEARQRDFPTIDGSTVQRTLPANSRVTGRWVRGRDPTSRWLKLTGGGYIWDGNLAQPGGEGSPIELGITGGTQNFGPELEAYLNRVRAQRRAEYDRVDRLPDTERDAALEEIEEQSTWLRIPARHWRGLTITAVAQHYESQGLIFREDKAAVRGALMAAGLQVDAVGFIPLSNEEFATCSLTSTAAWPEARAYGATSLTCGL